MDHYDQKPTWQGSRPDDGNTFPATPGQPPYPPQQPYPPHNPGHPGGGYQAPGAAPPGGQYPGAPYPGWGQPPGRRGLQWWHWLLIAAGSGALVLCCACSFVGYAVTQSPSFKAGYATAEATRYPQATFTPQATVTPTVWVFGRMQLGSSAVRNGSGYTIVNPRDHFAARDPFAAVVDLGGPLNTNTVKLLIVSVDSSGTEKVAGLAGGICCTIDPTASWLVYTLPYTETLMPNYPQRPGTYKFEVVVGTTVVAQAKFTYTG